MVELTPDEKKRYRRQLSLPEIGEAGQQKLKQAKVLVVGAGGLGCPLLQYLVAAGVGTIGIVDGDVIELANLQRQVLYSTADIGKEKVAVAKEKLMTLNPEVEIHEHNYFLNSQNAIALLQRYDLVADGSDNFSCRYLVNDACVKSGKPFVSGALFRFTGQLGIFNYHESGTYRCLFPEPPMADDQTDCNDSGTMGVMAGVIGTLMANEVIKIITGAGDLLAGKILMVDLLSLKFQTLSFLRDHDAAAEILNHPLLSEADYKIFCNASSRSEVIKEISPAEFRKLSGNGKDFQLIDVREPDEHEEANIGGELIPYGELFFNVDRIANGKPVIIYCNVGMRSHIAIQRLQDKYDLKNLYNLKGGIKAYLKDEKKAGHGSYGSPAKNF